MSLWSDKFLAWAEEEAHLDDDEGEIVWVGLTLADAKALQAQLEKAIRETELERRARR
ncbi:MAG: hypothetical protein ACHQ0J_05110 [Candidatus Dormibacterales bacterium]